MLMVAVSPSRANQDAEPRLKYDCLFMPLLRLLKSKNEIELQALAHPLCPLPGLVKNSITKQ